MDQRDSVEDLDLLWGVRPIAKEIKRSDRQTYYMLENGRLPAQKVGSLWCASRKGLRKHFRSALRGELAKEET
jgi:hypothetical protein